MPDLATHLLFGQQVKNELAQPFADAVDRHPGVFAFGTQGPDLFFFRKALPHTNPIHKYGSILHKEKIPQTLAFFKNYTATYHYEPGGSILLSYFAGYLCHYFLDSSVHPYVYYLTKRRSQTSRLHAAAIHAQIEAQLDAFFYDHFYHQPISEFHFRTLFQVTESEKLVIARLYQSLMQHVYHKKLKPQEVVRSFDDFLSLSTMFFERPALLRKIGAAASSVYRPADIIAAHIKTGDFGEDTANTGHRVWNHPLYPQRVFTQSVPELFEAAREETVKNLKLCAQAMGQTSLPFPVSKDFSGNDLASLT